MLHLTVEHWLCHRAKRTIAIEGHAALVTGSNGAGKTALRDALEFLYLGTGQLRGIGTKKELAALSITDGESGCAVEVESPRMRLRREMKRDGSQKLFRQERAGPAEAWSEAEQIPMRKDGRSQIGGVAGDALRAVIEPTGFYQIDATRRREILIQSTSEGDQTAEAILQAMREALSPESPEDEQAMQTAAKWAADDGFRHAEESAGEARRSAKRELEAIPEMDQPACPDRGFRDHTLEEYEGRLRDLREQHTAAVAAEATTTTTIEGQLMEATTAQSQLENAEYEQPDQEAAAGLKAARETLKATTKALEDANRDLQTIAADVKRLEGPEAEPEAFAKPKTCPATPFEFKCPVKPATFAKAQPEGPVPTDIREKALVEAMSAQKTALGAQQSASDAVSAARDQEEAAERRAAAELARAAREEAHMEQIAKARARTQDLEGQLLEAQKAEIDGPEESAAKLAERITTGEATTKAKADFDLMVEAWEGGSAGRERARLQIARWDAIAKALKPDGIESRLGGGARERFEDLLGQLGGLAGRVHITANFEIEVERDGKRWHPLQLSTSQRLAVGLAIQHALAQLLEFPILCCDAIDIFDGEQRAAWHAFALEHGESYTGAILGLATLTAQGPPPAADGLDTFWIRPDGAIERITS